MRAASARRRSPAPSRSEPLGGGGPPRFPPVACVRPLPPGAGPLTAGSSRGPAGRPPAGRCRPGSEGKEEMPSARREDDFLKTFLQKADCQRDCRPPGAASPHLRRAAQRARERERRSASCLAVPFPQKVEN